jgi:hypothetical protein
MAKRSSVPVAFVLLAALTLPVTPALAASRTVGSPVGRRVRAAAAAAAISFLGSHHAHAAIFDPPPGAAARPHAGEIEPGDEGGVPRVLLVMSVAAFVADVAIRRAQRR